MQLSAIGGLGDVLVAQLGMGQAGRTDGQRSGDLLKDVRALRMDHAGVIHHEDLVIAMPGHVEPRVVGLQGVGLCVPLGGHMPFVQVSQDEVLGVVLGDEVGVYAPTAGLHAGRSRRHAAPIPDCRWRSSGWWTWAQAGVLSGAEQAVDKIAQADVRQM